MKTLSSVGSTNDTVTAANQTTIFKETQQYTDADKQPFETQNGINLTITIKSREHPHYICIPSPCTPFHTIT
jgi:hypothetical protein